MKNGHHTDKQYNDCHENFNEGKTSIFLVDSFHCCTHFDLIKFTHPDSRCRDNNAIIRWIVGRKNANSVICVRKTPCIKL